MIVLLLTIITALIGCATPEDLDTGEAELRDRIPDFSDASESAKEEVCYPGVDQEDPICMPLHSVGHHEQGYHYQQVQDPRYQAPTAYLDLRATAGDTPLSENMQLSELAAPHKGRWAVIQPHLIEALQGIRDQVGPVVVGSGYRSPAYNRQVGGAPHSRHLYGDAVDIYGLKVSMYEVEQACIDHGASYVERYDSHVHCDWRDVTLHSGFFGEAEDRSMHGKTHTHEATSEQEFDSWAIETFAW